MSSSAIVVKNLGKVYRIGDRQYYYTLRDVLHAAALSWVKRIRHPRARQSERAHVWALRNVSFEIPQGKVVGIIGRNGSGKSTLLRLLSRITYPSEGMAMVEGSVATLLEVGTGFHPELTGRDNIFLSGALLGMSKREIRRKFDEITAFSGVEKFIDTPLKFYSSGMYMRLAFAVAAHLEADIMFVDEVLAVGDLDFQKKCLRKMNDVARGGRTVLFVTHQMNQIRRLCEQTIWLESGEMRMFGPTSEVVGAYESSLSNVSLEKERSSSREGVRARFLKWEFCQTDGEISHTVSTTGPLQAVFYIKVHQPIPHGDFCFSLVNNDGQILWGASSPSKLEPGLHRISLFVPMLPLRPGVYYWTVVMLSEKEFVDSWQCFPPVTVSTIPLATVSDQYAGILNLPFEVRTESISE